MNNKTRLSNFLTHEIEKKLMTFPAELEQQEILDFISDYRLFRNAAYMLGRAGSADGARILQELSDSMERGCPDCAVKRFG